MKDKNLPLDNNMQSLDELTKEVDIMVESLEKEKDLQNSTDNYQELLKLNSVIEKQFIKNFKDINEEKKKKINSIISKKNAK